MLCMKAKADVLTFNVPHILEKYNDMKSLIPATKGCSNHEVTS